ncbi:hypothetical protein BDV19DRAFT_363857 [Aspergillus venezuelensis]
MIPAARFCPHELGFDVIYVLCIWFCTLDPSPMDLRRILQRTPSSFAQMRTLNEPKTNRYIQSSRRFLNGPRS